MQRHPDRADQATLLLQELAPLPGGLLDSFVKHFTKRAGFAQLSYPPLELLVAQISDTVRWFESSLPTSEPALRVFTPEVATHGYASDLVVVETFQPDQSFIFDSIKLAFEQQGLTVNRHLRLTFPLSAETEPNHYAYTRWELVADEGVSADDIRTLVASRLERARLMVTDFGAMTSTIAHLAERYAALGLHSDERNEAYAFLQWLLQDNFVFMGAAELDSQGQLRDKRPLGTARFASHLIATPESLAFIQLGAEGRLLQVNKSHIDSKLHRPGKLDLITLRTFDAQGQFSGALVVYGLFTFQAYSQTRSHIPELRRKLALILERSGSPQGDFDHKSISAAFTALPLEFLFATSDEALETIVEQTRRTHELNTPYTHIELSADQASGYAFFVIPRERYSDELRLMMQQRLDNELQTTHSEHRKQLGKFGATGLHIYFTRPQQRPLQPEQLRHLEEVLLELGTPWEKRLLRVLETTGFEATKVKALFSRYRNTFSEAYIGEGSAQLALTDLLASEKILSGTPLTFELIASEEHANEASLRIYSERELLLTDILPVIDNFGIVVIEQASWHLRPTGTEQTVYIDALRVLRGSHDLLARPQALLDGIAAVFAGKVRSDRINRLLLPASLTWREVDVLRSYFAYARQLGLSATALAVEKVLIQHAHFVHQLMALFHCRFDPASNLDVKARQEAQATLVSELERYLAGVSSFDEDRILRTFLGLVLATLRTNFYRSPDPVEPTHYLSFKFDCALVPDMPTPRPFREIWVHAYEVEGVHLRGGKVARGGLRWSDRLDDFRSEVLGLISTQMLKNAVIVPVGAKGGFVLKQPPEDWREARAKADRYYEVFIRGLLDLSDNLLSGQIIAPTDVVCHDEADPYLVVAADKGTAHLSDTANRLSAHYGFWLGDAFASGGSVGYDHKAKGITARGAWVSVERHFLELGKDPNKDPITVVGIGDMAGDVFGNGLLRSRSIKLVGAFNHQHIFLDPNPSDLEATFNERLRLFETKGSRWSDYNTALISEGGGIFERAAKSIPLSEALQHLLGTTKASASGEDIIRMLLKAEVDLLWNGGIGTYVKASSETHADAKDPANDRVRVDASELRCKVVGEGGNLGFTQRARNEYAERGGLCFMDAIDNAGGVDLSDHEVNIKTLLRLATDEGSLSPEARNALIIAVGDEVCDLVLADNFGQAQGITLDAVRSRSDIWSFQHTLMWLKARLSFSRYTEQLPNSSQLIAQRKEQGRGFLRSELSKLLLYAKMALSKALTERPIGTPEALLPTARAYFPARIVAEHGHHIANHFLFSEITATVLTNRIIDRAGASLVPRLALATDRHPSDIAAAWVLADKALQGEVLHAAIVAAKLPTDQRYALQLRVEEGIFNLAKGLLLTHPGQLTLANEERISTLQPLLAALAQRTPASDKARTTPDLVAELAQQSLPAHLASLLAIMPYLAHLPWATQIQAASPATAIERYFQATSQSGLGELFAALARQDWPDHWDILALGPLERQLHALVVQLARQASLSKEALADFAAQVGTLTSERVPVSALLVLGDRLRARLEATRHS